MGLSVSPTAQSNFGLSYLSQVSDQVEDFLRKGVVEVPADHVDPVGAVPGVAVRAVQAHHVGQVGERGGLLVCTHLGYFICRFFAERSWAVKVLDEMWQEAQDVQRETCRHVRRSEPTLKAKGEEILSGGKTCLPLV